MLRLSSGETDAAWSMFSRLAERMEALTASTSNIDHIGTVESVWFRLNYARLLLLRGQSGAAERRLRDVINQFARLVGEKPDFRDSLEGLGRAYFEYWQAFGQIQDNDIEALLEGYLATPEDIHSCTDADLAARLAVVDDNRELAKRYTQYALEKDYVAMNFIAFCRKFDLCT